MEMPFGLWTWVGSTKHVLDVLDPPCQETIITGKDMPGHARRHYAVSCAKMAEPIDLPFGLWTRVGRKKHKFNRIRQAPSKKGTAPHFSAHIYCGQTAGWIKMPLGTEVDLGPGHTVLDGASSSP